MNLVNSPVMHCFFDIWHSGHQSPIYDHGDSFAVYQETMPTILTAFKVPANQQGPPATLKKNDVTWISNDSYQAHQLRNKSDQLCCTIQCYQYRKDNYTTRASSSARMEMCAICSGTLPLDTDMEF